MKTHIIPFQNIGVLYTRFSPNDLSPIWEEVNEIKNNFSSFAKVNSALAGNIEHEYNLSKSLEYTERLMTPFLEQYKRVCGYGSNQPILTQNIPLSLTDLWVNFQKKYEFNPPHIHTSFLSFVIWLEIPYDIKDEKNHPRSKNSAMNIPGHFQFLYTNSLGFIESCNIPVDKSYNGGCVLFPSSMLHAVYPFTTSDNYRITVSGNYKCKV